MLLPQTRRPRRLGIGPILGPICDECAFWGPIGALRVHLLWMTLHLLDIWSPVRDRGQLPPFGRVRSVGIRDAAGSQFAEYLLAIFFTIFTFLWMFPEIRVPPNHPFIDGIIFITNHSFFCLWKLIIWHGLPTKRSLGLLLDPFLSGTHWLGHFEEIADWVIKKRKPWRWGDRKSTILLGLLGLLGVNYCWIYYIINIWQITTTCPKTQSINLW